MLLWNTGGTMSERTDVRDAFIRNYHRANRWQVAFHEIALEKGFLTPLPTMDAKGMIRAAVGAEELPRPMAHQRGDTGPVSASTSIS
jgi:hypothetical protein